MTKDDKNRPESLKGREGTGPRIGGQRRITSADLEAMASYYVAEHDVRGRKQVDVLLELGKRYDRDPRRIWEHIKKARGSAATRVAEMEKVHFERLAYAAKALAFNARIIHQHRGEAKTMDGNIVDGIRKLFRTEATHEEMHGGAPPKYIHHVVGNIPVNPVVCVGRRTTDRRYPREADETDAGYLLAHFKGQFPRIPVSDWRELEIEDVTQALVKALSHLTDVENLEYAPDCPRCREIKKQPTFYP